MLKYLTIATMLSSLNSYSYVEINSIEYYQQKSDIKEIIFDFKSDYLSTHTIEVTMEFYNIDNQFIKGYKNELKFLGKKKAIANINYNYYKNSYVLININYNGKYLINNAKINIYVQEDCFINIDNRECKRIYKSYYKNGVMGEEILKFIVNESDFYKYLYDNKLKLKDINFYSNYTFDKANIYLYLNDKIDGYDLIYNNGYRFLLFMDENNKFELIDNYFLNLIDFSFLENYKEGSYKVKEIYFPFIQDYKEYDLSLVIEDFISIKIDFIVFTKGNLLGDCSTSKYCLIHESD